MAALLERLGRDGLLKRGVTPEPESAPRPGPPHLELLTLCERGLLDGGLSVALGVRPDELIGPLCQAIGGSATRLRVVDVRDGPVLELRIRYGEVEEPWEVEDLLALVHNLNDLFAGDPKARAVAVLGEWEDALQLWCVHKRDLPKLWRADYFAPRNRQELARLLAVAGQGR
ncbi:MAG: hypothetical protein IRZ16_02025 [Myxococcaceae bacterium]|nr:hypothetical protein [Myxococcaceae bacterium]